jgi:hypothetical protein
VLDCDLKGLDYVLGDWHTPYPNIEEDMEFTKVLIVKQKLVAKLYSSIWTLESNTSRHHYIL